MITDVKISIENNLELYTIFPLVCILDIFYSKLILFIIREKLKNVSLMESLVLVYTVEAFSILSKPKQLTPTAS